LPWSRFELTTSVVIGTDNTGSCKSNYHTITTTTVNLWHLKSSCLGLKVKRHTTKLQCLFFIPPWSFRWQSLSVTYGRLLSTGTLDFLHHLKLNLITYKFEMCSLILITLFSAGCPEWCQYVKNYVRRRTIPRGKVRSSNQWHDRARTTRNT
jgi:hypothetical protein